MSNQLEIHPKSVVEMALDSQNQRAREFAMRITYLNNEARNKFTDGAHDMLLGLMFAGTAGYLLINVVSSSDQPVWARISAAFLSFGFGLLADRRMNRAYPSIKDFIQARMEASSLTTVLAAHLIAESDRV